jgi:hypothetical protein
MFGGDGMVNWPATLETVLALAGVAFVIVAIVLNLALVGLAVWIRRRVVE